jgi:hypothetical protein
MQRDKYVCDPPPRLPTSRTWKGTMRRQKQVLALNFDARNFDID